MDLINKIKKDKKLFLIVQALILIIGLTIYFLGGAQMLAISIILLSGFIIGRYFEKAMSAIKDFRLSQRIGRIEYDRQKFENLKKENDKLNEILRSSRVAPQGAAYAPSGGNPRHRMGFNEDKINYGEEYDY